MKEHENVPFTFVVVIESLMIAASYDASLLGPVF